MLSRSVASLAVLGMLQGPAASQTGAARPQPAPPVFQSEAVLIAVPVFVTNSFGRAVPGLTRDDFEVLDGGQPVPITAFEAVDVHDADPLETDDERPIAVQAAAPRQFLLLFDLVFSPRGSLTRVRRAATGFVESLGPRDLVAVATYGSNGMHLLTSFTLDRAYVARAIATLGLVQQNLASSDPLGLSGGGSGAAGEASGFDLDAELAEIEEEAERTRLQSYRRQVLDYLESIEELARVLAPLRGRKQIVLLSGGFASRVMTGSDFEAGPSDAFTQSRGDAVGPATIRGFARDLYRDAGRSDVVIHSIDLKGIEGPVDPGSATGRAVRDGGGLALHALAENTGGRAVLPTNDFGRAFGEVDAISRHYYVIAFQPADPAPKEGKPRGLRIRVRRDGLDVSHRPEWLVPAAAAASEKTAQLAAAETIAKGLTGGRVRLDVVALPYRDRDGRPSIPAVVRIDGSALFAAAHDGRDATLPVQLYGYALQDGRVLDTLDVKTAFDLAKAGPRLREEGFRVLTTFAAAPGVVELRFFVRAGRDGETGALRARVAVPGFTGAGLVVSAPLPTTAASGKVVAWFETAGKPPLEVPFRAAGAPFLPDPSTTLAAGQPRELCVFVWRGAAGGHDVLEVAGELERAGQAAVPVPIPGMRRASDPDGFERYLVTVGVPRGAAGAGTLRLTFRDPTTGATATAESRVLVTE